MSRRWNGPVWKLTTAEHTTHNGTLWGEGVSNPKGVLTGRGGLCGSGFYHGYDSPYLAILLNPIHANIVEPVLWQAEWRGTRENDNGLKFGATEFRTVQIVEAPRFTTEQQVAFSIFCAALVWDESTCPAWQEWSVKWLSGEDRSQSAESAAWSARSAAQSAESAAWSARSAAWSAGSAAWSAAWSARSAAWSAAASAAESAAWSARSAAESAAASAAESAAASAAESAAASAAESAAVVLESAVAWALTFEAGS